MELLARTNSALALILHSIVRNFSFGELNRTDFFGGFLG
jgi:hypothetical protein